jgi:Tfp pilus assembly protein PilN
MIHINLKPGARRASAKGSRPLFAGMAEGFKGLSSRIKEPWLALAVGAWVLVILGCGFSVVRNASQVSKLQPQVDASRSEFRRYQGFLLQKRKEEKVRDSTLAQIGTIAAVDQDRFVWPHIVDEVGNAVPDFTWLTSIAAVAAPPSSSPGDSAGGAPSVTIKIVGRTSDLTNYTAFLRRLEESPWLGDVLPIDAKTITLNNRLITEFTIQAAFTKADSSYIKTVPILESVVR